MSAARNMSCNSEELFNWYNLALQLSDVTLASNWSSSCCSMRLSGAALYLVAAYSIAWEVFE